MKNQMIPYLTAALAALSIPISSQQLQASPEARVTVHAVSGSGIEGKWLHDELDNPIGTVKGVLLIPKQNAPMVVVKTSVLKDNREILVPWTALAVENHPDNPSEIHVSMAADLRSLTLAPAYTGSPKVFEQDVAIAKNYWGDRVESASGSGDAEHGGEAHGEEFSEEAVRPTREAEEEAVSERVKDGVKDAVDETRDAIGKGINRAGAAIEKVGRKIRPD